MAKTGNVAPQIENPIIAHNEQILIDIRSDGTNPKKNTAKPCDDITVKKLSRTILNILPLCGKFK